MILTMATTKTMIATMTKNTTTITSVKKSFKQVQKIQFLLCTQNDKKAMKIKFTLLL